MKKQTCFTIVAIALTAILISTTPTHAQILWGTATNVTTDTDVLTNGAYFDAALLDGNSDLGGSGAVGISNFLTVNSVSFNTLANGNSAADPSGDIALVSQRNFPFGGGNSPSGTAAYNTLVDHPEYSFNAQTITLNHLTIGDTYQVEVWSSAIGKGKFLTDLSGTNSVTLNANTGQYAVGTFLATSNNLVFTASSDVNTVNGANMLDSISVRDITEVPEPSAYALLFAGLLSLGILQSRRQKSQAL